MKQIPRFMAPMTFGDALYARLGLYSKAVAQFRFEQRFALYLEVDHAIAAPSGRFSFAALLSAFEFPKGGEVIVPALTFHSMPQRIRELGLEPVFVDVLPGAYVIDPEKVKAAVTEKTVAILPTHLYGRACDMDAILRIAREHDLRVIEDCAQGCGAQYNGRRLGSIGDAGLFSFGPTKNLAMLWAGMITTGDSALAYKARGYTGDLPSISIFESTRRLIFALAMRVATNKLMWRFVVKPLLSLIAKPGDDPIERMTAETPGANNPVDKKARMMPSAFQLGIGCWQLEKLDRSNLRRIENGELLIEKLSDLPGLTVPEPSPRGENIFMSFPVLVDDREKIRAELLKRGVDTAIGYMSVCPGLQDRALAASTAPVATAAANRMLHMPVYPELTRTEIDQIVRAFEAILAE